jgi:AAA domain
VSGRLVDQLSPADLHALRRVLQGDEAASGDLGLLGRLFLASPNGYAAEDAFDAHVRTLPPIEQKVLLERLHGTDTSVPPPEPRFRLLGPEELRAMPSPSWLVPRMFVKDSLGLVYGDRASLKSFALQNLAWAGATGVTWRGRRLRPFRTIYIAGEGAQAIGKRLRAFELRNGVDVTGEHFRVLIGKVPKLNVGDDLRELAPVAAEFGPDQIICDTLNRTLSGNENETEVMAAYVGGMNDLRLACPGAFICAIHHTARAGNSRGGIVLEDNVDTIFRVERDERELACRFECEKQKDGAEEDPFELTFAIQELPEIDPDTGDQATSLVVEQKDRRPMPKLGGNDQVALDVLAQASGPCSYTAWSKLAADEGVAARTFDRTRDRLVKLGLVRRLTDGGYEVRPGDRS